MCQCAAAAAVSRFKVSSTRVKHTPVYDPCPFTSRVFVSGLAGREKAPAGDKFSSWLKSTNACMCLPYLLFEKLAFGMSVDRFSVSFPALVIAVTCQRP